MAKNNEKIKDVNENKAANENNAASENKAADTNTAVHDDNVKSTAEQNANTIRSDKKNIAAENNKQDKKAKAKGNMKTNAQKKIVQAAKKLQRAENESALIYKNARKGLVINALGQWLYELGFELEYTALRFYRVFYYIFSTLLKTIQLLFLALLRPLLSFVRGILRDLIAPFTSLFKAIIKPKKQTKKASQNTKKELTSVLFQWLSYLLPVGGAAILGLTVYFSLSTPYALAATQDGVLFGYIENDTIWDAAEKTVEARVNAANDRQSLEITPTFTLISTQDEEMLSVAQLADRIIEESSDQIGEATGVYVNESLVGISINKAELQQILDDVMEQEQSLYPDARISFTNDIRLEDGLYYTESITDALQVQNTLEGNNYLQTQIIITQTRTEEIPFETQTEDSDLYFTGTSIISQSGINGIKEITEDVSYINGVEVNRVFLSEAVTQEPRTQITLNGTRQNVAGAGSFEGDIMLGSGTFIWPVATYTMTTTEFGGYHRGLDIAAPLGTPIYACDTGTVTEAGYHGSWGYYVLIDHGNGFSTRYAHCSRLDVAPGMNVQQGTQVGLVGNTGYSFGNHLHLEIMINTVPVNPRGYVAQP